MKHASQYMIGFYPAIDKNGYPLAGQIDYILFYANNVLTACQTAQTIMTRFPEYSRWYVGIECGNGAETEYFAKYENGTFELDKKEIAKWQRLYEKI